MKNPIHTEKKISGIKDFNALKNVCCLIGLLGFCFPETRAVKYFIWIIYICYSISQAVA